MSKIQIKGFSPDLNAPLTVHDVTEEFLENLKEINPQLKEMELREIYALLGLDPAEIATVQAHTQSFIGLDKILNIDQTDSSDEPQWIQVPEVKEIATAPEGGIATLPAAATSEPDISKTFDSEYVRPTLGSVNNQDPITFETSNGVLVETMGLKGKLEGLDGFNFENIQFSGELTGETKIVTAVAPDNDEIAAPIVVGPFPPDAVDDLLEASEHIFRFFPLVNFGLGILDNDTDPQGSPITVVTPIGPVELFDSANTSVGTVPLFFTGSDFAFFPFDGINFLPDGEYHFTYTIANGFGLEDTATVTILYTNAPPFPVIDIFNVPGVNVPISFTSILLGANDISLDPFITLPPLNPPTLFFDAGLTLPVPINLYQFTYNGGTDTYTFIANNFGFPETGDALPDGTYFAGYVDSDFEKTALGLMRFDVQNAIPIAVPDVVGVDGTTAGTILNLLSLGFIQGAVLVANDIDPGGDPLFLSNPIGSLFLFSDANATTLPLDPLVFGYELTFSGGVYTLKTHVGDNFQSGGFLPDGNYFMPYFVTDGASSAKGVVRIAYFDNPPFVAAQAGFHIAPDAVSHIFHPVGNATDLTDTAILFDTRVLSPPVGDVQLFDAGNNLINPALYNLVFDPITQNYQLNLVPDIGGNFLAPGDYHFNFSVSDGLKSTASSFTITVDSVAPVITAVTNQSAHEVSLSTVKFLVNTQKTADVLPLSEGTPLPGSKINDMPPFTFVLPVQDLKAYFISEGAGFRNGVGFYKVLDDGTITDVTMMWPDASTSPSTLQSGVVNDPTTSPSSFEMGDFALGDRLAFFMVANMFSHNNGQILTIAGNQFFDITVNSQHIRFDTQGGVALHTNSSDITGHLGFFNETVGGLTPAHMTDINPKLYFIATDPNNNTPIEIKIPTEYGNNAGWWHSTDPAGNQINSDNIPHVFSAFDPNWNLFVGFEDLRGPLNSPGNDTDFNDVLISVPLITQRTYFNLPLADVTIDDPQNNLIQSATIQLDPGITGAKLTAYNDALFFQPLGLHATLSPDNLTLTITGVASESVYSQAMDTIVKTVPSQTNFAQIDVTNAVAGTIHLTYTATDVFGHIAAAVQAQGTLVP